MKSRMYVWTLGLLLLAGCGKDSPQPAPQENEVTAEEELTAVLTGQMLLIDGYHGTITIEGRNDSTATFAVMKKGHGANEAEAQARLEGVSVEAVEGDPYILRVLSNQPEQTAVDVQARIPYRTPLRLDLERGDVTVRAVSAPIRAVVDNGSVDVNGATNNLNVEVSNGNVAVKMVGFRDDTTVHITVNNGNIDLELPAGTSASVQAVTQAGQVDASGLALNEQDATTTTSGRRVTGTLGSGTGRVEVRTQNGSIRLHGGK